MPDFFSPTVAPPESGGKELDWGALVRAGLTGPAKAWSAPEAFYCVLFSAAGGDGAISHEAQEELLALVHRSRALKTSSGEELFHLNASVVERLRGGHDGALAEACAALPSDMRASSFAHALDIVLSDGDLSEQEARFLNALIAHFKLDVANVRAIADIIILKNKY